MYSRHTHSHSQTRWIGLLVAISMLLIFSVTAVDAKALSPGAKKVAVIFVNFADQSNHTVTQETMRQRVFTGTDSVNAFTKEVSYQTVSLTGHESPTGDVFGPYAIASSLANGCENPQYMTFASQARAAMQADGHNPSNYDYFVYVLPATNGCPANGWTDTSPTQHVFTSANMAAKVLTHEFGHAYGLQHANRLDCNLGTLKVTFAPSGSCTGVAYGDNMDIMGDSTDATANLFNGAQRARIGLIPASSVHRTTAFGTYTISDLNTTPNGVNKQLLMIPGPVETTYRYIEFRRALSVFDAFGPPHEGSTGVGVRQGLDYLDIQGHTFNVLVASPSSFKTSADPYGLERGILRAGKSMYDPATNTTIKTVSVGATSATVSYTSGSPAPASQVSLQSGVLSITGGAGQVNDFAVATVGSNVEVVDNGGPLTMVAGCTQTNPSRITCPSSAVSSISAVLGDEDDAFASTTPVPTTVSAGAGDDVIRTASGQDRISLGSGNDFIAPGGGVDTLDNSDRISAITADLSVVTGTLQTSATETDSIAGIGSDGFDHYIGGSGSDTVTTGQSPGQYAGGAGNDTFKMKTRNHSIDGGGDFDTADFTLRNTSPVTVSLDGNIGDGARSGEASNIQPTIERVVGTSSVDKLVGSSGSDTLEGMAGPDEIIGEGGADVLLGGDQDDQIKARDGTPDTIDCGAGTSDSALVDPGETAPNCEQVATTTESSLTVTNGTMIFAASAGSTEQLTVTASGADYVVADNGGSTIVPGAGCVSITTTSAACSGSITEASFTLLDGDDSLNQTTALNTTAYGGVGADSLTSAGGEDILDGGDNNDALNPGSGADYAIGGAGDDAIQIRDGGQADIGDCGLGFADTATADQPDYVQDCEQVQYGAPVSITAGPANGSSTSDSTPEFSFSSSEPGTTFRCSVDGAAFTTCSSPTTLTALSDGSHSFAVAGVDGFGYQGSAATRTFTVDTVQPSVSVTSPAQGAVLTTQNVSMAFTVSADAVSRTCRMDSGTIETSCVSPKTYSFLTEGSHTFTLTASDAAGNVATAVRSFLVDTTPPALSITSPVSGQYLTSANLSATFTVGADSVAQTCQMDSGAIDSACVSPKAYSGLSNGDHTLTITARDAAGNVRTEAVTFTVSAVPPTLTLATSTPSGNTALSTVGTTDWIHWGRDNTTSLNRKSGSPSPSITGFTKIGTAALTRVTSGSPGFTWTGGTPTATQSSATQTRVTTSGVNNGFRITVPATNTATRTIRIYAGVNKSRGRLRATLSDGSVAEINNTSTTSTLSTADRVFTLSYRSSAPTATLTIEWTMSASNLSGSNVRLAAAALSP